MSNTIWGTTIDSLTWKRLSKTTEAACHDPVTILSPSSSTNYTTINTPSLQSAKSLFKTVPST